MLRSLPVWKNLLQLLGPGSRRGPDVSCRRVRLSELRRYADGSGGAGGGASRAEQSAAATARFRRARDSQELLRTDEFVGLELLLEALQERHKRMRAFEVLKVVVHPKQNYANRAVTQPIVGVPFETSE